MCVKNQIIYLLPKASGTVSILSYAIDSDHEKSYNTPFPLMVDGDIPKTHIDGQTDCLNYCLWRKR